MNLRDELLLRVVAANPVPDNIATADDWAERYARAMWKIVDALMARHIDEPSDMISKKAVVAMLDGYAVNYEAMSRDAQRKRDIVRLQTYRNVAFDIRNNMIAWCERWTTGEQA